MLSHKASTRSIRFDEEFNHSCKSVKCSSFLLRLENVDSSGEQNKKAPLPGSIMSFTIDWVLDVGRPNVEPEAMFGYSTKNQNGDDE